MSFDLCNKCRLTSSPCHGAWKSLLPQISQIKRQLTHLPRCVVNKTDHRVVDSFYGAVFPGFRWWHLEKSTFCAMPCGKKENHLGRRRVYLFVCSEWYTGQNIQFDSALWTNGVFFLSRTKRESAQRCGHIYTFGYIHIPQKICRFFCYCNRDLSETFSFFPKVTFTIKLENAQTYQQCQTITIFWEKSEKYILNYKRDRPKIPQIPSCSCPPGNKPPKSEDQQLRPFLFASWNRKQDELSTECSRTEMWTGITRVAHFQISCLKMLVSFLTKPKLWPSCGPEADGW